jgi:hypothetical protein
MSNAIVEIVLRSSLLILFFVFVELATAADLNGYTSKNEVSLSIPRPKDSPSCSGKSQSLGNGQYIIRGTDFDPAIFNSTIYSQFFVCPGDYRSKGDVKITKSGTKETRRYLVGYHPSWTLKTKLWDSEIADPTFDQFTLYGAQWWIVDRIKVKPKTRSSGNIGFEFYPNTEADHNILNRIECDGRELGVDDTKNPSCVYINKRTSYSSVQNSFIHDCQPRHNNDSYGIYIRSSTDHIYIINNELRNCTQQIQVGAENMESPGTTIENNDMYFDTWVRMPCRTDADWPRDRDPNGRCDCSEGNIDMKSGGSKEEPLLFIYNRVWGNREQGYDKGTRECGGSGGYTGRAIATLNYARNIVVRQNILSDSEIGIVNSHGGQEHRNITFKNNLIHDIRDFATDRDWDKPRQAKPSAAFVEYRGSKMSFIYNTIVNSDYSYRPRGRDAQYKCNLFVNAGDKLSGNFGGGPRDYNVYVGNSISQGEQHKLIYTVPEAHFKRYCYWRRLQTKPELVCVDNVLPTTATLFIQKCSRDAFSSEYGAIEP